MNTATDYIPESPKFSTIPAPSIRRATMNDVRRVYKQPSLADLSTSHMTTEQREGYERVLTNVRKWRQDVPYNRGLSFMLSSKQVGVGKTHIAKAVNASFCRVIGNMEFRNDVPEFWLEYRSRLYTARELINLLGGDQQKELWQIVPKHIQCLVIDDLGREGYIDYVKADQQAQEKQSRYFHLLNHLYETRRNGNYPVNIFITTNLTTDEVQELLGDANWSRLLEMCPRGYIQEMSGLTDYRRVASGRA